MLDSRLRLAADLVRQGSRVADIGTDHAQLPVALVAEGRCPSAIASDVRSGPVENARRTVEQAELTEAVSVRLGDGLHTVHPDEVDDIVIAGMGGETIAAILEEAPWVKDARYRLILQPMTRAEKLRAALYANGFEILVERVTRVGRHWYTVMCAAFTGKVTVADAAHCHAGRIPLPEGDGYLQVVENRLLRQHRACPTEETEACLEAVRRYRRETPGFLEEK
ncbi:MAG: SAM-dependent methyltransferase [Clostridia bacterium]|nr:SAM-dependent methyltransferase [Clostridia bacterium]